MTSKELHETSLRKGRFDIQLSQQWNRRLHRTNEFRIVWVTGGKKRSSTVSYIREYVGYWMVLNRHELLLCTVKNKLKKQIKEIHEPLTTRHSLSKLGPCVWSTAGCLSLFDCDGFRVVRTLLVIVFGFLFAINGLPLGNYDWRSGKSEIHPWSRICGWSVSSTPTQPWNRQALPLIYFTKPAVQKGVRGTTGREKCTGISIAPWLWDRWLEVGDSPPLRGHFPCSNLSPLLLILTVAVIRPCWLSGKICNSSMIYGSYTSWILVRSIWCSCDRAPHRYWRTFYCI